MPVFLVHFVFWMLGVILGIATANIFFNRTMIGGVIQVDNRSNLCKVHISTTELSNLKTKKVMFNVVHRSRFVARRTSTIMGDLCLLKLRRYFYEHRNRESLMARLQ